MRLTDFFENVENDDILHGVDVTIDEHPGLDCVLLRDTSASQDVNILVETILEYDWETLRDAALSRTNPQPVYHVTRIVGYFSRIENWNQSKLGELADRRKGDYRIAPQQVSEELQQMSMSA